jgi:hypothetical protein
MMFQEIITKFGVNLFSVDERPIMNKVIPKKDLEDVELGNVKCRYSPSHINYPDLELGFGPIIEVESGDLFVGANSFDCQNVIHKNYASFMDMMDYLFTPLKVLDKKFLVIIENDYSSYDNTTGCDVLHMPKNLNH